MCTPILRDKTLEATIVVGVSAAVCLVMWAMRNGCISSLQACRGTKIFTAKCAKPWSPCIRLHGEGILLHDSRLSVVSSNLAHEEGKALPSDSRDCFVTAKQPYQLRSGRGFGGAPGTSILAYAVESTELRACISRWRGYSRLRLGSKITRRYFSFSTAPCFVFCPRSPCSSVTSPDPQSYLTYTGAGCMPCTSLVLSLGE